MIMMISRVEMVATVNVTVALLCDLTASSVNKNCEANALHINYFYTCVPSLCQFTVTVITAILTKLM